MVEKLIKTEYVDSIITVLAICEMPQKKWVTSNRTTRLYFVNHDADGCGKKENAR